MRKPTDCERSMNFDSSKTELSSQYGQLLDISCFEPVDVVIDSPNVKLNKPVNVQKETQLSFFHFGLIFVK